MLVSHWTTVQFQGHRQFRNLFPVLELLGISGVSHRTLLVGAYSNLSRTERIFQPRRKNMEDIMKRFFLAVLITSFPSAARWRSLVRPKP